MDWERIATSAVVSEISKTNILSGFISEGDKEPCWDGHIYIHEDEKYSKRNIKRIPTQVKGKAVTTKKVRQFITYQVSYDDLHAYMMDGGILFFVVYIDKKTGNALQIYYSALLPINIMEIIKNKQKSYSISFNQFPNDNNKKIEIVLDAYANAQRQKSYAGSNLPSIDELSNEGILESLSFHFTHIGKTVSPRTVPQILEGKSLTIYANIKGNPIGIPVEHHPNISHVVTYQDFDTRISVDGITFFDQYRQVYSVSETKLMIGKCLVFTIPLSKSEENIPTEIAINIKGTLQQQIQGFKFVLAMAAHGGLKIGEKFVPVALMKAGFNKRISAYRKRLEELEYIQRLLDKMHVSKDLQFDKLEKCEIKSLNFLIGAIGEKRPIKNIPEELGKVHTLKLSNLSLAVMYARHVNGNYYLYDYFGEHLDFYEEYNECKRRISQYAILNAEDFMKYDNLYLPNIIEDFQMLPVSSDILSHGNFLMLEMLKAFDLCNNIDLLLAAGQMNEWLLKYPDLIDEQICTINQYQIIIRQRELHFDEKVALLSIAENATDISLKAGALILLGEMDKAGQLFTSFTEEQTSVFHEFPIYTLYCRGCGKS